MYCIRCLLVIFVSSPASVREGSTRKISCFSIPLLVSQQDSPLASHKVKLAPVSPQAQFTTEICSPDERAMVTASDSTSEVHGRGGCGSQNLQMPLGPFRQLQAPTLCALLKGLSLHVPSPFLIHIQTFAAEKLSSIR